MQAPLGFRCSAAPQLRKLRLRRLFVVLFKKPPSSTPAPLRMTKSAFSLRLMRRFASPTSKTALPFSEPLDQSARPFPSRNNITLAKPLHSFTRLSHKVSSFSRNTSTKPKRTASKTERKMATTSPRECTSVNKESKVMRGTLRNVSVSRSIFSSTV